MRIRKSAPGLYWWYINAVAQGNCVVGPSADNEYESDGHDPEAHGSHCQELDPQVWHQRCGHASFSVLTRMQREGMVEGVNVSRAQFAEAACSSAVCPGCAMGKQHRRVVFDLPTNMPPVTAALSLVHMDVCGPMPHTGRDNSRYIATFLDDYTGLSVIQLLQSKDQVPAAIQRVITELETQSGQRCKALRSDNGSEYCNKTVQDWCSSKGIQQQFSAPYCPEQNGKAERLNRTIMQSTRSMLLTSGLPPGFWVDAARKANYVRDLLPITGQSLTPWEAFYHRKPNLSALRVFGATAWVFVTAPNRNKLQAKAVKGVLLGYAVVANGSSKPSSPPSTSVLQCDMVGERGRWAFAHTCFRATPSTAAGAPAGLPVAAGAPITGTAPAANNTPSLSAAAPAFADVEKITGLQPAQALDLLRSVLTSLNSIVSAQPQAAPAPPATAAGVGSLSYAGALTAAPILPEVGTSAAAAAADEIQRLRQQLVGVTAHLEAAQNEAVRVRAELSEMESLQDRQNVVVSGEQGVAAIRSQSDRPVVNRSSGTSAALPALGAAPALSGTVAPVAPLSGRQTPLSQVAPPANATLAAPVPMSRVKIPGPDKWTDQCLATSRVAEIFCEDLEVHCAYLRIDPADALPNFLTGKAREVWYPATRNAHILAHGSRPTWVHLRASFKEMAGDDLRNESDVHRRKLLDPNALRMSAGSTLNAYITDFRNTLTVAGSTCMAPAMLVATFIRGLTSELQSSVVHDLALMRDPTLNDAIQAAVNAQKVLFAVATNHVGRRPPAPHVAAFVPPKQMNRLKTPPGLAGGPPPPAHRGPYWDVSSSSSSGGHRGSRHSSQGGGRHAGRAAQAPPATAPVCPAPAAGGSTLPIPGYACHHCWNPNHFRDYCNLKHLPADEARRVSGYPRPASLGPPSRHANPPGDLPPRPQKRDRSPPGKGGWKQQGSRGDRRR
ncbi:hypothetical protein QJQ45_004720 [Haematococcus lacustris]|nr:hypothetical protein QJQ45_004720 [Haematococcus lacustris]